MQTSTRWTFLAHKISTFFLLCEVSKEVTVPSYFSQSVFSEISQNSDYLFNIVAGLQLATLLKKKRIWKKSFPVNFRKFSKTSFFARNISGWTTIVCRRQNDFRNLWLIACWSCIHSLSQRFLVRKASCILRPSGFHMIQP